MSKPYDLGDPRVNDIYTDHWELKIERASSEQR